MWQHSEEGQAGQPARKEKGPRPLLQMGFAAVAEGKAGAAPPLHAYRGSNDTRAEMIQSTSLVS